MLLEHQALFAKAGNGWRKDTDGQILIETGSHLEYLLKSVGPVVVENFETETRFLPSQSLRDRGVMSSISLLIRNGLQPFGILSIYSTTPHHFSTDEVLFFQASASLLTAVLQRQEAMVAFTRVEAINVAKQTLEREIVALKQVEALLRQSEERYALIANEMNDGVWDWNLDANEVYFSPHWKAMLGYEANEIGNNLQDWFNQIHPEDRDRVNQELTQHYEGLTSCFESQYRLLHKDGQYRWMLSRGLAVRDVSGKAYRVIGSQTDITARKIGEEQLRYNALHDGLTGLANRSLFMERLKHAIALGDRHDDYKFAVVFLDVDRFKVINDSLGHVVGDQLLITIAHRLKGCLRSSDTCARLGGDEFAILLEYVQDDREALRVVERLQQLLSTPFQLNGQEVFANASIGIILSTRGYDKPDNLIRDADTAMYRAKALGRGRYEVFTQEMHEHAVSLCN